MTAATASPRHRSRPRQHRPADGADARAVERAGRRAAKLRVRVERAEARGDRRAVRALRRLWYGSFHARLAAGGRVNDGRKPRQRVPLERVVEAASHADAHRTGRGGARVFQKPKAGGGHRPILDAILETRIAQRMVAEDIECWVRARLHPSQYLLQGGRDAAAREAMRHVARCDWVVNLDVKDFYPSCDAGALADLLPVSRRMARAAIDASSLDLQPVAKRSGGVRHPWCRKMRGSDTERPTAKKAAGGYDKPTTRRCEVEPQTNAHPPVLLGGDVPRCAGAQCGRDEHRRKTPTEDCQRGLVQGSPASVLVAEFEMSGVLAALPSGARLVCYADNIVAFAPTEAEALRVRDTLVRALLRSPAGELRFGKREVVRVECCFYFLGYTFRTVRGVPVATPTYENQQEVFDKFVGHMTRRRYDEARRCVRQWAAQFRLWSSVDRWLEWALSEVNYAANQYRIDGEVDEMADALGLRE